MSNSDGVLLGLTYWGALSAQGEVLSTQGLCFLLRNRDLNCGVTRLIAERSGLASRIVSSGTRRQAKRMGPVPTSRVPTMLAIRS